MSINFAAFLGVSALVIMAPGQDTALTIRNTLVGGRRAGVATTAGVVSGLATWTVATSAGLAALIVASQPLFLALRLAGAAYLVFLGVQALRAALFSERESAVDTPSPPRPLPSPSRRGPGWGPYVQGLLSNLGNPKIVVFFLSLLPQFIDRGQASADELVDALRHRRRQGRRLSTPRSGPAGTRGDDRPGPDRTRPQARDRTSLSAPTPSAHRSAAQRQRA